MNKNNNQYKNKHFLIYKITNLDNGMIYIGKHQTYNPNDTYMGSSPYLNAAIQKYGINRFKKEILFDFDNYDDMNNKEIELVNENFIKRKDTYNVELGGNGGWNAINNKPYKWICNPYFGKNMKFYEDIIPQYLIDVGWTYGMLSKVNMTLIKDIDGNVIPIKAFASKHNLKSYLVFQRLQLNWNITEILTIPEDYGCNKKSKEQRKQETYKKIAEKNKAHYAQLKQDNIKNNKRIAYEKYQEYINLGKDVFKKKYSRKEYRKWLSMFRIYVNEYKTKKANVLIHKIEYNGKCQSMSKWCKELNINKWKLYTLVNSGKTFQEAFDILIKLT